MQCPEGYSKDVWDALPPELQEELAPNASARVPGFPQPKQKSLLGFLDGGGPAVDLTKKEAQSSSPNSPQRKVKQAKLSRDNGTIGVAGLDYGAEEEKSFTDPEFRATASSIDGMAEASSSSTIPTPVAMCHCGVPVVIRRVLKAGPNQGRMYKTCAKPSVQYIKRCDYFGWATAQDAEASRKESLSSLVMWQRFSRSSGFRMTTSRGWTPDSILQGKVGDCWFLSAVAIVANRADLCKAIVNDYPEIPDDGKLSFNLYINGLKTTVLVDNFLPVSTEDSYLTKKNGGKRAGSGKAPTLKRRGGSANIRGVDSLVFSNCDSNACLWVPFLEKAYAKAHGSYMAIHGGWVHEALFDLTGAPVMDIYFAQRSFNKEETWQNLVKWHDLKYPMGCGRCSPSPSSRRPLFIVSIRCCLYYLSIG